MISARNLSKSFGKRVLFSHLSFSFQKGILEIKGKSGAGKSTLLMILMGYLKPDEGEVTYGKENLTFSYCGQSGSLLVKQSLKKNLKTLAPDIDPQRFQRLIRLFGFKTPDRPLRTLSGGERRKAEIIFALSKKADYYLLDEPFRSLDKKSRQALADYLKEFALTHPVILVNHIESLSLPVSKIITLGETPNTASEDVFAEDSFHELKKKDNVWLAFKQYFVSLPFYSFLRMAFFALASVFFSLALSYANFRSVYQNTVSMMKQDPFSAHSLNIRRFAGTPDIQAMKLAQENLTPALRISDVDQGSLCLYGTLEQGNDAYYFSNVPNPLLQNEKEMIVNTLKYQIHPVTDLKTQVPIMTQRLRKLSDGLLKEEVLFVPKSFIRQVLLSRIQKITFADFAFHITPLLPLKYNQANNTLGGGYYDEGSADRVVIEERSDIYLALPGQEPGKEVYFGSDHIRKLSTNGESRDQRIHLSLPLAEFLLMPLSLRTQEQDHTFFFSGKDEDLFPVIKLGKGYFGPYQVISDYSDSGESRRNNCFIIAGALYGFSLLFLLLTDRTGRRKAGSIREVYEASQYSLFSYRKGMFLASMTETIPGLVLSFVLYPVLFLKKSNEFAMINRFSPAPEGFYYYSQQPLNPYYDQIIEPMQVFPFAGWIFLLILFALFLSLIGTYFLVRNHREKK